MKKARWLFVLFVFSSFYAFSQDIPVVSEKKYKLFAAFTGGPSLPVGKFGSKSANDVNSESGFANFGYNINIHIGYQASKNYGVASTIFYSRYKLNIDEVNKQLSGTLPSGTSLTADHWQYYGILVGPIGTIPVNSKILIDIKFLGGVSRANFPVFSFANSSSQEKWTNSFAWQGGANMRYNFTPKACFFTNLDYNFMEPTWKLDDTTDGTTTKVSVKQKMGVLDVNVGMGINF